METNYYKGRYAKLFFVVLLVLASAGMYGQERVYVSTDKNCYLAGEEMWLSVFCMDGESGRFSRLSHLAYLEFHSMEGLAGVVKVALKDGRGCGRFKIPFSFATGNYSIVSYTGYCGGNQKGEFNGKVVTVFNTLAGEKVEGGVEVVDKGVSLKGSGQDISVTAGLDVEVLQMEDGRMPVRISNGLGSDAFLNVSVYNIDGIEEMVGEWGYSSVPLLERRGDFEAAGSVDYAGETIRAKVSPKNGSHDVAGKTVYMSAVGDTDDVYISTTDSAGVAVFHTNNIYGNRDIVFEVGSDTLKGYDVELLPHRYVHKPAPVPLLKISGEMEEALKERSVDMQVMRRFEADTLLDLMEMRGSSFIGDVVPMVYNLDDYTRFPVMEEVISEYVKGLRVRRVDGRPALRVLWEAVGVPLVLLDGVPVQDHMAVIKMDPLLVKQIVVYPRRYVLNNFIFEGVVKFNTYKGDMGGVKFGKNVSIQSFQGAMYPLAFLGNGVYGAGEFPNLNRTIYWNPAVALKDGESLEAGCVVPDYAGVFRVVVEGIDARGKGVYATAVFEIK